VKAFEVGEWQVHPSLNRLTRGIEEVRVDEVGRELYIADSYLGGRIMVFDLDTFAFKRGWGAHGRRLADISTNDADHVYIPGGPPPKDYVGHLTLAVSNDGLVYAADRRANRIDVTTKDGKLVREFMISAMTPSDRGAAGGVTFSSDKEQRYLIISDMANSHVWFLNRADGKVLGNFGTMGDQGGLFYGLHMVEVDSRNYVYTGEVFAGERIQRFVPAASPRGKLLEQLSAMP
jgi:DNA-binding beta-propeller fold protein YncE